MTVPLRMAAQYRVGVAMLMPEQGLVDQPHPTKWTLLGGPTASDPSVPVLFGTSRHVTFTAPVTGDREYDQTPAAAAPAPTAIVGQEFMLRGLNILDTCPVYLVTYTGTTETETDISTWRQPLTKPYVTAPIDGIPFLLRPPAPPAVCPPPGQYGLRIGTVADPSWRSATVPFLIAPWLDPTGGPLLTASGGIFTALTANIPAAGAEVRLGTTSLNRITSGSPAAGEWLLTGATLTFAAPSGMAAGQYAIRLRAADIESDPALWAVLT